MSNVSVRVSWTSNYGDSYYEETIELPINVTDIQEILESCRQYLIASGDWHREDLYDLEVEKITINR